MMPSTDWVIACFPWAPPAPQEAYRNFCATAMPMAERGGALRFRRLLRGEPPTEEPHALRAARLHLHPRPSAGAPQALRDRHLEDLGDARHQARRFLDRADRRKQQRPPL